MTLLDLLHRALASEVGIVLAAESDTEARRLRRRVYDLRDQERRRDGSTEFDPISVLLRPGGEVWLVNRSNVPKAKPIPAAARNLTLAELPTIRARGRCRSGIPMYSILSGGSGR